jgi:hypothetical protein
MPQKDSEDFSEEFTEASPSNESVRDVEQLLSDGSFNMKGRIIQVLLYLFVFGIVLFFVFIATDVFVKTVFPEFNGVIEALSNL